MAFNSKELEAIDELWREALNLFVSAGLVPVDDLKVLFDDQRFADIRRAAVIAQDLDIAELRDAQPFLAQLRAFRPKSVSDIDALKFAK